MSVPNAALIAAIVFAVPATALFAGGSPEFATAEQVDLIEVNHYYDENGAHLLDQILFYEWDGREARYQVRAWRLLKSPQQYPRPVADGQTFETTWREAGAMRVVRSSKFRETWTQYDPELLERRNLPREERRELFQSAATP
jgi:hypothetical protein